MPLLLKEMEILPQIAGLESVLIVPCRFCPAASLAVRESKPYLEPFRHLLRTESFESFIQSLSRRLRDRGIRTAVFDSKLPHQFVACMWSTGRRQHLAKRAAAPWCRTSRNRPRRAAANDQRRSPSTGPTTLTAK